MKQELNAKYARFFDDDEAKSQILADELKVSKEEFEAVQGYFLLFLKKHREPEYNRVNTIQELASKLEKIAASLSLGASGLVLAKLIYYNNIVQSGFLRSEVFGITTKFFTDEIRSRLGVADFSLAEFTALTQYLKHNFFVCPNGEVLENILKIEKRNKILTRANDEEKLNIVRNLLCVIGQTQFHHDIVVFKKLLAAVNPNDEKTIRYIKNFIPENRQGCYLAVNKILNSACFDGEFSLAVKAIKWLDSARGARPGKGWSDKFAEIKNEIGVKAAQGIADEILRYENLAYHDFGSYSWSDDVMKRFIKSALWIKETAEI